MERGNSLRQKAASSQINIHIMYDESRTCVRTSAALYITCIVNMKTPCPCFATGGDRGAEDCGRPPRCWEALRGGWRWLRYGEFRFRLLYLDTLVDFVCSRQGIHLDTKFTNTQRIYSGDESCLYYIKSINHTQMCLATTRLIWVVAATSALMSNISECSIQKY